MKNLNSNPKVDFYFSKVKKWRQEIEQLRTIVLDSGLDEKLKWGCPCYGISKDNIVLIHVFKEYCALLFFKGALLKDPENILIQQTKNVQSARQIRFINEQGIIKQKHLIKRYINEAIEIEKSGLKVPSVRHEALIFPVEIQQKFNENPTLKNAFDALTPGRQRGYNLYFSAPKQSKTIVERVEKYTAKILQGKGINDN